MKKKAIKHKKITSLKIFPEDLPSDFNNQDYEGLPIDIMTHAWMSHFIGWLSPASLSLALFDWFAHLTISPAKQVSMLKQALEKWFELFYTLQCLSTESERPTFDTRTNDHRFDHELWQTFPFNLSVHYFLMCEKWWDQATVSIRGVSRHHQKVVNFQVRQFLDMISPSNFLLTNPEVLAKTFNSGGSNLFHGFQNLLEDLFRYNHRLPPNATEKYVVGKDVAITPGKVVYRNHLIELIQYEPQTKTVHAEPILIIPAWIMKYYILDLSPHNSLVKYLVANGFTVFMISWKNPTSQDRHLGLEDYLNLGIFDSLNTICKIIPDKKIHTVGYCIGGTLLMIAAAALASQSDQKLQSITLFAAQIDFKEAGDLLLFMDQSQVTFLEDIMWEKGYLDGRQMANAFSMLQSNDLIWSRVIHDYLFGERRKINDLIAWDYDTTRLPIRMHSEYLHNLFLNNDLSQGRFKVNYKKIALPDITQPLFVVSTIKDHVSPWRSVYKVHLFCDVEITFVLTTGGHNAGIVSEPGHVGRSFRIKTHGADDKHISSESWLEIASQYEGSWWPKWVKWLHKKSSPIKVKPPSMGNKEAGIVPLLEAPGNYVLKR